MISNTETKIYINLSCAFYKSCTLPKRNSLCAQFPEFTICPEYQTKKEKLTQQK